MNQDDIDDVVDELEEEEDLGTPSDSTGGSWLYSNFKVIAILLSVVMSPVCAHVASGRVERLRIKFEREDRVKKRQMQLHIHQQKMRTTLVKEIVSIAKNADLNNVAHAYRMGLIAEIVMTNPDVFKLNMKDAKEKLDIIIKKMKVVHNIRKQLAATEKSETELHGKVKQYDKENVDLEKKLKKVRKKYDAAKWRGYAARIKWQKKVTDAEKALQRSRSHRLEYYNRLRRERHRRYMYARHLRYTQRRLQVNMSAAKKAKKKSDGEIKKLNGVLASLGAKASVASKEVSQLRELARKLTKAKQAAEITAQYLSDEVKKLKADNKTLTVKLVSCKPKDGMAIP